MDALKPHKSAFDINSPRTISDNLAMPKTVVATISNWLNAKDHHVDQSRMAAFRI